MPQCHLVIYLRPATSSEAVIQAFKPYAKYCITVAFETVVKRCVEWWHYTNIGARTIYCPRCLCPFHCPPHYPTPHPRRPQRVMTVGLH